MIHYLKYIIELNLFLSWHQYKESASDRFVYNREEGDLLIDWEELVAVDTDDNESQGRLTPSDALSVDNMAMSNSECKCFC